MVGAVRAGHVGVRGGGGRRVGRRGGRAAARVRGLHVLRQVRGRAARPRQAQGRLRQAAAAGCEDEGTIPDRADCLQVVRGTPQQTRC